MTECLDTSVIVKWFKEGERYEKEANLLKDKIIAFETEVVINEWAQLELARALVKSGFSKDKILKALDYTEELIKNSAVRSIAVNEVKQMTQKLQIELLLYTGDAVHLATAIYTSSNIFWGDDKHFKRAEIVRFAKENGVIIRSLEELNENDDYRKEENGS